MDEPTVHGTNEFVGSGESKKSPPQLRRRFLRVESLAIDFNCDRNSRRAVEEAK
jgi:hypothetical protein